MLRKTNPLIQGTVIKTTGSWHTVLFADGRTVPCRIRGKFRIKNTEITNPVAVGDQVDVVFQSGEHTGLITHIHERKNYIIRKSSKLSKRAQILATNIDQAILVITLESPVTTTVFTDRFLAAAEAYRIPVLMVFNKTDLYEEESLEELNNRIGLYSSLGYTCLATSVISGQGLDKLAEAIDGKTSLISGHSGVGKSSLLNAIDPSLKLRISDISEYHQAGKHTTTFPEMIRLSTGGRIIDTPGIKGFGSVDMNKEEIFHFFREIFTVSKHCRFHNCLHMGEPHCAVKESVEKGTISLSRYISYLNIMDEEEDEKYRS